MAQAEVSVSVQALLLACGSKGNPLDYSCVVAGTTSPSPAASSTAAEHAIAVLAGQAQPGAQGSSRVCPVREMLAGAMSQENEQLLRRGYKRLNASDIEGFLRFCATDFEMHDLPSLPGAGVHVGHDDARAWWARMCEIFGELRFDPDEILDAGDGRFVVVCHVYGRGTLSGASIDGLTFNIWTVRDGKLSSCLTYDTHAEALAAGGLEQHQSLGPGVQPTEL